MSAKAKGVFYRILSLRNDLVKRTIMSTLMYPLLQNSFYRVVIKSISDKKNKTTESGSRGIQLNEIDVLIGIYLKLDRHCVWLGLQLA